MGNLIYKRKVDKMETHTDGEYWLQLMKYYHDKALDVDDFYSHVVALCKSYEDERISG